MEMLLVNPRRRRKGRARARRRSPKRRRRMSAKQLAFFGGGRKRRRNPSRRHRARGRRRSRARGYRRNPSRRLGIPSLKGVSGQVMGALPGAVGALGLDVLLGLLPIPVTWKAGVLGYATKIAGAIGLGMIAKMVVRESTAAQMTNGALTVMFHGILRDFVATNVPSVPLGMYLPNRGNMNGLGYYGSGWNPAGAGASDSDLGLGRVGAYLPDMDMGGGSFDTDTFDTTGGEYN